MELIVNLSLYLVGGGAIGVLAAWSVRHLAGAGAGIKWRADGWPRGIQEEEPRSDWGARFRTPAVLARRSAEAATTPTIEELSDAGAANIPLQHVRR